PPGVASAEIEAQSVIGTEPSLRCECRIVNSTLKEPQGTRRPSNVPRREDRMKLKRVVIAVLVGATVLGAGVVAQSAFGSGTASPTQVIVERLGNGQTRTWIVTSPEAVSARYRDGMGLPQAHLERLMCPTMESLYTYRLT